MSIGFYKLWQRGTLYRPEADGRLLATKGKWWPVVWRLIVPTALRPSRTIENTATNDSFARIVRHRRRVSFCSEAAIRQLSCWPTNAQSVGPRRPEHVICLSL
jgi:hypothetical protein